MTIPAPTHQDMLAISERLGLGITEEQSKIYAEVVAKSITTYGPVAEISAEDTPLRPAGGSREHTVPTAEDNRHNAWFVRSSITEKSTGPLAGRTVVVKDSIPVAGLPMIAGSNLFEGYVPDFDAEVVRRVLEAGGTVSGKAHCEYLCFSGASHTNVTGPIRNPWGDGYSTGGSSSGSAALVALGEADMSLGADQAGSIRMPSSFCGIVGLKPTTGLVPYTGIPSLDAEFDHVGPMTADVADNALLLSVLAGPDGIDPRQHGVEPSDYQGALDQGVKGLRIGVLKEGFEVPGTQRAVAERVRAAADVLARLGATVHEVSVPQHRLGLDIWSTIGWTGMTETALRHNGIGIYRDDHYPVSLMEWAHRHGSAIDQAPPSVKLFFVISEYVTKHIGYAGYGRGVNAARVLRGKYDEILKDVDLLLMPTTPMTALPLPDPSSGIEDELRTSHPMAFNTAPFDITHHPALTLPCGPGDNDMPVGLMLVGRHYKEATVYRAAKAYEDTGEGAFRP
ncbi:amidase [Streptomyces sp. NPDC059255]|uniref:amidase n=1 Tax=Streptomyces sp. NPDC059255 TaxID=3346793 RepID=UPI003681E821